MMKIEKSLFVYLSTHTYSNLSRLFLRLFIGVILLQLGVNQMANFESFSSLPGLCGMEGCTTVSVVIAVELICSTLIILGLLTRVAIIPLIIIMASAVGMAMNGMATATGEVFGLQPMMLPMLICGILVFFGIAGPGKISLDYILARYIVSYDSSSTEEEKTLEEA